MIKIVISATSLLFLLGLPVAAMSGGALQEIKEQEQIRSMYDRAVALFTRKIPEEFEYRRNNSVGYIDFIKTIFGEKGIPHEMAYLPFIESGFSPVAVGPGDAAGLWQFMKGTAEKYGLRIDAYVDERKDPVKSTYAAAEYLRDLYSMFGKWDVVLAAYNAGDGKIRRLVAKADPAGLRLPNVINKYIARLLAVFTMAEEPEKYGFTAVDDDQIETISYVEVKTSVRTGLAKIATQYNTTVSAIRDLNPALIGNQTPPYHYVILVPANESK
jgi:membrane-bound lytic murein transglycosylase D